MVDRRQALQESFDAPRRADLLSRTLMLQPRLRRTIILATILLVSGLPLFAQSSHARNAHGHKRAEREQIEGLEHEMQRAQLDGDTATLERLLSDDYLGISPNGELSTKAQQIDHMRERQLVITKYDVDDLKIKLIGQTAIVTSQVQLEGSLDAMPLRGHYRYTRIYQRLANGTWKVTSFEATRVRRPEDAAPAAAQPTDNKPGL
jgi:ketosteroid isomerase-like protein